VAAVAYLASGSGTRSLAQRFLAPHQARLVSEFELFPLVPDDIVFLGDSITEEGPWEEIFPDLRVRNRGISGDTADGVLKRLDQVTRGQPAKVFLLIGTNDLFRGDSEDEIVANIIEILARLKDETPDTEVYLQSVLPRAPAYRARIEALNSRLSEVALENGVEWVDLYPHFVDSATDGIREELSNDELHLLGPGYALWRDQIELAVRRGEDDDEDAEPALEDGAEADEGAEPGELATPPSEEGA
jgi:lysophospholipase L1-like esterase